uniref:Uncharacterized protein n=1 Tax=Arion vulgaris TaxID=1028688 RepID=A0A0B7B6E2_9EUPU
MSAILQIVDALTQPPLSGSYSINQLECTQECSFVDCSHSSVLVTTSTFIVMLLVVILNPPLATLKHSSDAHKQISLDTFERFKKNEMCR